MAVAVSVTASMRVHGRAVLYAGLDNTRLMARASTGVAQRYMATGWIATEPWLASHADVALRFGAAIHRTAIWPMPPSRVGRDPGEILKVDPAIAAKMYRAPYALALEPRLIQPRSTTAAKLYASASVPPIH